MTPESNMFLEYVAKARQKPFRALEKTVSLLSTYVGAAFNILQDKDDYLIPPEELVFVGSGDFRKQGEEFLKYFIEYGNMQPNDHVLDIGCGIGRMALPLTHYLSKQGEYNGFDIVITGIKWCKERYFINNRNFHFQFVDVFNTSYNQVGTLKASEFEFPYADSSFDFAFLTSVFTHMLIEDLEHYLAEVSRVLRPGKKCLISLFLLNKESRQNIAEGRSSLGFEYLIEGGLTVNAEKPEDATAFEESLIRKLYDKYGLSMDYPILYGSWSGRKDFLSYQDIVVAMKQ
jgi:ubiquinone/menaquinone biosynthesis C-methylase UbiE